jgi:hypothetical protein
MKKTKTQKKDLKAQMHNAAEQKTPEEGDKDKKGFVYSNLYKGFVPGLYAQGR